MLSAFGRTFCQTVRPVSNSRKLITDHRLNISTVAYIPESCAIIDHRSDHRSPINRQSSF